MFRIAFAIALFLMPSAAVAADVIGLSLPLQGRYEPVASRMEFGAYMALEDLQKAGRDIELVTVDDGCDPGKIPGTVKALQQAGARLTLGPICFQSAKTFSQRMNAGDIKHPVITLNTRTKQLSRARKFDGLPLFSLSNPPNAEAEAVVGKILPLWASKPFAIVDDGSIYGRNLADNMRLLAEEAGFRPVMTANFRPLQSNQISMLRRLERSGVKAVFIAAAPEDVVTIARDIKSLNFNWEIATGEQSYLLPFAENAPAVPPGLLMVRERDPVISPKLLAKLRANNNEAENSVVIGYVLVEVAAKALQNIDNAISGQTFATVIGNVTFGPDGRASPLPFALYRWDGGQFALANGN